MAGYAKWRWYLYLPCAKLVPSFSPSAFDLVLVLGDRSTPEEVRPKDAEPPLQYLNSPVICATLE